MVILFDFSNQDHVSGWEPVNDVVMGGCSSSTFEATHAGTALFGGELSLDQGGGFASVRQKSANMGSIGSDSLVLRVRGDGRTYKLRLITENPAEGESYLAPFITQSGRWTEHEFSSRDFHASRRGRPDPSAPTLDFKHIKAFGLLLADQKAGSFELELAWMVGK
jgi:hypothetical protein